MAMNPLDMNFLSGMLQAHDMEEDAIEQYLDMASREETSDPMVQTMAIDMKAAIEAASDKIKMHLEQNAGDNLTVNGMQHAMDNVQVTSNSNPPAAVASADGMGY